MDNLDAAGDVGQVACHILCMGFTRIIIVRQDHNVFICKILVKCCSPFAGTIATCGATKPQINKVVCILFALADIDVFCFDDLGQVVWHQVHPFDIPLPPAMSVRLPQADLLVRKPANLHHGVALCVLIIIGVLDVA